MSKGVYLSLGSSDWAYLYSLWRQESLGDRQGTYSAEDEEGRPFLVFSSGHDQKTGAPQYDKEAIENGRISSFYGTKPFVWAEEEDLEGLHPVPWDRLYGYVLHAGLPCRGFWDEVLVHRGYAAGGKPLFHRALRGRSDLGVNWWSSVYPAKKTAVSAGWEILDERHYAYPGEESVDYIELYKEFS